MCVLISTAGTVYRHQSERAAAGISCCTVTRRDHRLARTPGSDWLTDTRTDTRADDSFAGGFGRMKGRTLRAIRYSSSRRLLTHSYRRIHLKAGRESAWPAVTDLRGKIYQTVVDVVAVVVVERDCHC